MSAMLLINAFIDARTEVKRSIIEVQIIEVPLYRNLIYGLLRVS